MTKLLKHRNDLKFNFISIINHQIVLNDEKCQQASLKAIEH